MKLHIHNISHPLIQNLYNITNESGIPKSITIQANRHLGLFMIYETIRKLIKVYDLKIKQIRSNKDLSLIDPKDSYAIIFNDLQHLDMFQDIQLLLPRVNLELIKKKDIKLVTRKDFNLETIDLYTKIIIVNYDINVQYIKELIHLFTKKNQIRTDQISIICIKCTTNQLVQLSESELYKNLTIYTAKIIKE